MMKLPGGHPELLLSYYGALQCVFDGAHMEFACNAAWIAQPLTIKYRQQVPRGAAAHGAPWLLLGALQGARPGCAFGCLCGQRAEDPFDGLRARWP